MALLVDGHGKEAVYQMFLKPTRITEMNSQKEGGILIQNWKILVPSTLRKKYLDKIHFKYNCVIIGKTK